MIIWGAGFDDPLYFCLPFSLSSPPEPLPAAQTSLQGAKCCSQCCSELRKLLGSEPQRGLGHNPCTTIIDVALL